MLILNAWHGGNEAIYAYVFTPRAHAQKRGLVSFPDPSHGEEGSGNIAIPKLF